MFSSKNVIVLEKNTNIKAKRPSKEGVFLFKSIKIISQMSKKSTEWNQFQTLRQKKYKKCLMSSTNTAL